MHINDWKRARLLLSPDGDGSSDEADAKELGFQRLVQRYKEDATGLAKDLYNENFSLRRKNSELTSKATDAEAQERASGIVRLTKEEAQVWASYQTLGTPEVLKAAVEGRDSLQGKLDSLERQASIREIADTAGFVYDVLLDADILTEQKSGKKLNYLVKEVETEGVKSKVAYVQDGDKETPLSDFAQENWPKLLPSLVVAQESQGGSSKVSNGILYPPQHQGSGGGNRPASARQQTEATLAKQYPKSSPKT